MKRPFPVTLTIVLVLMFASWNALRVWTALHWKPILAEFEATMPPIMSMIMGAFWFIICAVLLFSIWQQKAWSGKMLLGAGAGYTVWVWSGRFIWQTPRPDTTFTIIINLACLILIYFTSKSLTREAYERITENPKTE